MRPDAEKETCEQKPLLPHFRFDRLRSNAARRSTTNGLIYGKDHTIEPWFLQENSQIVLPQFQPQLQRLPLSPPPRQESRFLWRERLYCGVEAGRIVGLDLLLFGEEQLRRSELGCVAACLGQF